MLTGLIVGELVRVGQPLMNVHQQKMPGLPTIRYSGWRGPSGTYSVVLESARNNGKPFFFSRAGVPGFVGPIATQIEMDGTFILPFSGAQISRWTPSP